MKVHVLVQDFNFMCMYTFMYFFVKNSRKKLFFFFIHFLKISASFKKQDENINANDLELWFYSWRLNLALKKCNFMVYNRRKGKTKLEFKTLGDTNLYYKHHLETIRKKF
jgi:hypothetical protein